MRRSLNVNPLEALHLQLRLEGKEVVRGHRLQQVEAVPGEELPLLVWARLAGGSLVSYCAQPLQASLCEALTKLVEQLSFPQPDPLIQFLESQNIGCEVGHYKTYIVPEHYAAFRDETVQCFSRDDARVQAFEFADFAEPVYAVEQAGRLISACVSTRENQFCGEAWVFTDPAHRGQGLARRAVSAWAAGLLRAGKVPFYSHQIENAGSARLAEQLKLQPVFEELVFRPSDPLQVIPDTG